MDEQIYILMASKFLEMCGCDKGAAIYSVVPTISKRQENYKSLYTHSLKNQPELIDSALEVFTGKHTGVAKGSYVYTKIKEEKEALLNLLGQSRQLAKIPGSISDNKISAALSLISHSYIDSLFYPVQFFLPHSSICSGQWNFWDKTDYLELIKNIHQKETIKLLSQKLLKSSVWKIKFNPNDFPEIVKRRLTKEKLFDKKLDPAALIKAIIIRMGELTSPSINYEVIDFSIRSFFTYLGVKKYLRIDREVFFLRALEKEIKETLAKI